MWNSKRYENGYRDAKYTYETSGAAVAVAEYNSLDGARAVDEYEVGYSTFLNEKGVDPANHETYAGC